MWTTPFYDVWIVEWLDALPGPGVVVAHSRNAVFHGNAIRAGISAKVMVKGAVLLHDNDDVFDVVSRVGQDALVSTHIVGGCDDLSLSGFRNET